MTWVEEAERLRDKRIAAEADLADLCKQMRDKEREIENLKRDRKTVIAKGKRPKKGDLVEVKPPNFDPATADFDDRPWLRRYPYMAVIVSDPTWNERVDVVRLEQLHLYEQYKPTPPKPGERQPMFRRDRNPYTYDEFASYLQPAFS